ncbi:hypothetical protein [Serpentinicella alkaliphila]|uniref:Uncharacterized protein n=1 Tax=Serpentinicella alkaliphila TaxID=1734049 RepID=A0A4R2SYV6_9FIRM|nr:hypothetical protein [Serpentinicella alkaliphila]QUH26186.1 hypothetical protein HZR23_10895 [Serpentinicella alkaliphila]TCP95707.1 hypothetical protein EDD79_10572 [Serpentinicella alkaliphila]
MSEKKELLKIYYIYIGLFALTNIVSSISITLIDGKKALITGIIWVIATILIYYFLISKKESLIIIYSTINAILTGVVISSYYSIKLASPYNPLILVVMFAISMLLNYKFLIKIKQKKTFIKNNIIATTIVIIISVIVWIVYSLSVGSSLLFMNVIYLCFNISLFRAIDKDYIYIRILGNASMLMFGGILFFVIQALTEGEGIDIFVDSWSENYNKKRIK